MNEVTLNQFEQELYDRLITDINKVADVKLREAMINTLDILIDNLLEGWRKY